MPSRPPSPSPLAVALTIAAVSPLLSASNTLNSLTLCSILAPWVALVGVAEIGAEVGSALVDPVVAKEAPELLMVVLRCGRVDDVVLERGALGERRPLEDITGESAGLEVMLGSSCSAGAPSVGTSPRLEMRCKARVTAERVRLCGLKEGVKLADDVP